MYQFLHALLLLKAESLSVGLWELWWQRTCVVRAAQETQPHNALFLFYFFIFLLMGKVDFLGEKIFFWSISRWPKYYSIFSIKKWGESQTLGLFSDIWLLWGFPSQHNVAVHITQTWPVDLTLKMGHILGYLISRPGVYTLEQLSWMDLRVTIIFKTIMLSPYWWGNMMTLVC